MKIRCIKSLTPNVSVGDEFDAIPGEDGEYTIILSGQEIDVVLEGKLWHFEVIE